jgi:thiamine biosynthesis lipoprotein
MKRIWKILLAVFVITIIISLAYTAGKRSAENQEYSENTVAMGTAASFTLYGSEGEKCIDDITDILDELENKEISWRSEESEISDVNKNYQPGENYEISEELYHVLDRTLSISEKSGDLLDITIRPLADTWGVEDGKTQVPDKENIEESLKYVDVTAVSLSSEYENDERNESIDNKENNDSNESKSNNKSNDNSTSKYYVNISKESMSLDLGAVGKGYGCDVISEYLENANVTGACVALGGSIVVMGKKNDSTSWKVGVKNPRAEDEVLGIIDIESSTPVFVSTSGDYEKYFMENGKRYHHILNPKDGYPADEGIIAATVVCDNGLTSDALSTVCMLAGFDQAVALLKEYNAEAIIVDSEKNVYITQGLEDKFTPKSEDYNYIYEEDRK